jgi:cytochrome c oxidase subunit II
MDTTATGILPPPSSTLAPEVDALFNFVLIASIIFFLIVVVGMIIFVSRYRRREGRLVGEGPSHNRWLEIVWALIPLVLVFIVFLWGFRVYMKMNIVPGNALEIKVTAQKWFWSFDYPGGATSLNDLVVPVDRPIKLVMSSTDVIHSFFVPNFRMKMDVLPNRYTVTWFEATQTGNYNLFCTEYCGTGHSEMIGKVNVVSQREYDEWLETSASAGEDMSLTDFGAQLYQSKACITCHSIDGRPQVGPSFKGRYGTQVQLQNGEAVLADANYMRESILNPQAKIAAGYQPVMPTYQGLLKDREIDALIEYIKSLQDENENP